MACKSPLDLLFKAIFNPGTSLACLYPSNGQETCSPFSIAPGARRRSPIMASVGFHFRLRLPAAAGQSAMAHGPGALRGPN
jgi:hypothetical protein